MIRSEAQIITTWQSNIIEVSFLCTTYNHGKFIEETIVAFLNQITNFPFEIIIHDDASTDDTVEIIKKYQLLYPNIIKPIFQEINQYSLKLACIWTDFLFKVAKGSFFALCEGDDYWTNPSKTQIQVDYLKNHDNTSIVWTNWQTLSDAKITSNNFLDSLPNFLLINFDNLFNPYCTMTLTCLFRANAVDMDDYKVLKHKKDNSLYALLLQKGNGVFLNFEAAVYRHHAGGIYSLKDFFFQRYSSYLNIKEIYETIPKARTKNIDFVITSLIKDAAFEVLKLRKNNEKLEKEHLTAVLAHLKNVSFKHRFRFFKYFLLKKML